MKRLLFLLTLSCSLCTALSAQEHFGDVSILVDSSLTRQYKNTTVYRDSTGNVFLKLKVMSHGDVLVFENGSPYENKAAVIFSELTREELEFIIAQIRYFEKRKKVKQ